MIEIKNLHKSFGHVEVLKGVDVSIEEKEVVVIIGPSGSGKSTLLRCMNYLEEPTSGDITVDNMKLDKHADINKIRENIGMVFQRFNLFPHMTVLENLTLSLTKVRHMEEEKANEIACNYLTRVGLLDKKDEYPNKLSGGQKQRLLILCCMMKEPEIIFLDEPTAYLDDENRRRMRKIIYDLCYKYHKTVVIASHDLDMLEIADKHYHIENQQILLKKNIIKENKNLIARKTILTFPLNYYLHAQKEKKKY